MAGDPKAAVLALHRFGFGARPGSIESIASDPRGALVAELDQPKAGQITRADLPTSASANRAVFEYQAERNAMRQRQRRAAAQTAMEASGKEGTEGAQSQSEAVPLPREL